MNDGTRVAKRYAKALYEAAETAGTLDAVKKDLQNIDSLMENREIRDFCKRPSTSRHAARQFAETALFPNIRTSEAKNLLDIVLKNTRLALLPLLKEAFEEISDAKTGVVSVDAVFASEPDEKLLNQVEKKMRERVGGTIRLRARTDKRLIRGFRILWNSRLIDRSVAGGVRDMRLALKR